MERQSHNEREFHPHTRTKYANEIMYPDVSDIREQMKHLSLINSHCNKLKAINHTSTLPFVNKSSDGHPRPALQKAINFSLMNALKTRTKRVQ